MKEQNYSNHRKYVHGFHFVLFLLGILALVGSIFFLVKSFIHGADRVVSTVIFFGAINFIVLYFYSRDFATTVQDRAIRAEENLRYYALTGNLLDPRLTVQQIVALRFAPDLELVGLVSRTITENLSNDDIKKEIKVWRPDLNRA
ncbi:MAG: DUF6526 family protein [Ignavibacteriaceae bacterium]|nr:DUF6526 family protein [Ignavibacteriaceae bacterium]